MVSGRESEGADEWGDAGLGGEAAFYALKKFDSFLWSLQAPNRWQQHGSHHGDAADPEDDSEDVQHPGDCEPLDAHPGRPSARGRKYNGT